MSIKISMKYHGQARIFPMAFMPKSSPITDLDRPLGFQEVEAPRFLDNRHMKVVGCQPYAPAAFTPQEIFLVLISVRG
jgi:hypothetical protein